MTSYSQFHALGRDLRSASRSLRAAPGSTVVILAVMSLAMGAAISIFSVVDAVVLRTLPFDQADRLISFDRTISGRVVNSSYAAPEFLALRDHPDVFEGVAAIAKDTLVVRRDVAKDPEILPIERVSAEFFQVVRVPPASGRPLVKEDEADGRDRVAVISYGFWQRRFGGAPDILGKRLPTERGDVEVVGVMPANFAFPVGAVPPTDLWMPYVVPRAERSARVSSYLRLIARLRDGVTMGQAQARTDQIAATSVVDGRGAGLGPTPTLRNLHESLTGYTRSWILMLLAAAGCVLLLACSNIANLLLVRATVRMRELAVRSALGATRWDLARLLLAESLLLSVIGTVVAVLVARWGMGTIVSLLPPDLPRLANIAIDTRVLAASAVAAFGTGIGFGLAPVVYGSDAVGRELTESGRANTASTRRRWLQTTFLVAEVALAVVLLVGTALFLASFSRLMRVDVGLDYRNVLMVDVRPKSTEAANAPGLARVMERISAIPGVESVAVASGNVPFSLSFTSAPPSLPGRRLPTGAPSSIGVSAVSPEYFRVLRIPLRAGRYFTLSDSEASESVTILTETAAKLLFPGENPIGQQVGAGFGNPRAVVGVVNDVRGFGPEGRTALQAFTPAAPGQVGRGTLLVKFTENGSAISPQVKTAIWSEFPDLAIPAPRMLEASFGVLVAQRRFSMFLLSVFGVLGVTIAAIGIYGVMSYIVAQRRREIGIRMTLGALSSTILVSVLRRASAQVGGGLLIGFGVAWFAAMSVRTFLFGVEPHDWRLYLAVASALLVTAFAAALIPARRAAHVDPIVALRSE